MMFETFSALAPAKLNLCLHVVGKRADGYHLLETVFQLLDIGDQMYFSVREDADIRRVTEIPGVPEAHDLILRAARLLQRALQHKHPHFPRYGVDIAIEKVLPLGGGLGGGSSNAATTLMVLNWLWNRPTARLTPQELMALGSQLGADVPFFIFGRSALATGIGEKLTPVRTPAGWYVIIFPNVSVPTTDIFASEELTSHLKALKIRPFQMNQIGKNWRNDLQSVVCSRFPEVAEVIAWLNQFGVAKMTGSGACVFCFFLKEQCAESVFRQVPSKWKAWKAYALHQHPLHCLCCL